MSVLIPAGTADLVYWANDASVNDMSVITRIAWIYPTSTSGDGGVLTKHGGAAGYTNFGVTSTFQLQTAVSRQTVQLNARSQANYITQDKWQFVACWIDRNVNGNNRLYRGTEAEVVTECPSYVLQTAGSGVWNSDASGNLTAGNYYPGYSWGDFAGGKIALVAQYNRHLSLKELREQQYNFHPVVAKANCQLFSVLGMGLGNQYDWSPDGRAGTITGTLTMSDNPRIPNAGGFYNQTTYNKTVPGYSPDDKYYSIRGTM